ncbi:hypothetical protein AB0L00_04270 [Actinoallomurus sp. NPDC052308]|uniref:hypothetical protein n=1 Tax=Actinoallomurus sp. NPDC052308 TaxID=3155530 RepID=UPI003420A4A0
MGGDHGVRAVPTFVVGVAGPAVRDAAAWALVAGWAYATAETYLLTLRRGRMAVLRGAARARATLIGCAAAAVALTAALVLLAPARAAAAIPLSVDRPVATTAGYGLTGAVCGGLAARRRGAVLERVRAGVLHRALALAPQDGRPLAA